MTVFGLVHGLLGFAGALEEIGLPASHLPLALLTFNVGVEIGQLFAVGVAYGIFRLLRGRSWAPALKDSTVTPVTPALWASATATRMMLRRVRVQFVPTARPAAS